MAITSLSIGALASLFYMVNISEVELTRKANVYGSLHSKSKKQKGSKAGAENIEEMADDEYKKMENEPL